MAPSCCALDMATNHEHKYAPVGEKQELSLTSYSFEMFIEGELHRNVCDSQQAWKESSEKGAPALRAINSQSSI